MDDAGSQYEFMKNDRGCYQERTVCLKCEMDAKSKVHRLPGSLVLVSFHPTRISSNERD